MADWERRALGGLPCYQAAALANLAGVVHGFTTREGGVSAAPYDSLNLGSHVGDDPAAVEDNRSRVCRALGFQQAQAALAEQVHGSSVAVVESGGLALGADALVTRQTGLLLMLFFADCVPVYVVDPTHRAIGLVHSGWRGTASGIVPRTLDVMHDRFESRAETCLAAVGPSIGGGNYEVGQDVVDELRRLGPAGSVDAITPREGSAGKHFLDLRRVIHAQLLEAGLSADNIAVSGEDTFHNRRDFFSFRRDGRTGRMAGFLALRPRPDEKGHV